ncbi:HNH endonuclease [Acinetobacter lwoffii]|uniref:HNH endonuclease n=1 Tax=Acinetobacter lwoffii TaxID=28090 RepID=UPI00209A7C3C|nr:HNH endonuclease [Acinetobacter lwoffii]
MDTLWDFQQLDLTNTRFFIFDSKSDHLVYEDRDFKEYHWDQSKYNRVREGDFFLYRRPQKASEIKNQFYLYGAGRIAKIIAPNAIPQNHQKRRTKPVFAEVIDGIRFIDPILQSDLEDFQWTFKPRGNTWEHFFQQYGMNEITADDFWRLLKLAGIGEKQDALLDTHLRQEILDYSVEDQYANVKVRGSPHQEFALQVKLNYQYQCAISGIKTKAFLVASHIVPWSENQVHRRNPRNGICLSSLLDQAFDQGFITLDKGLKVCLANQAKQDASLYAYLKLYHGKRIDVPKRFAPDPVFLAWHRAHRFLEQPNDL